MTTTNQMRKEVSINGSIIEVEQLSPLCFQCPYCEFKETLTLVSLHIQSEHMKKDSATRFPVDFRFDILDPEFILTLSKIGNHGAKKYGDFNYQKSRLTGINGAVNHMYHHLHKYQTNKLYDHEDVGTERKYHLAAIAFNAMMEFWYECHPEVK